MKGLIKKDFLLLKNNLVYYLVVTIVFVAFSITGMDFNVAFMLPFIAVMIFISTFSWDDFNNWNAYAITLPVGRKNIVKSKYISAVILMMVSSLLALSITVLTLVCSKETFDLTTVLSDIMGTLLGLVLVVSLLVPCIYKFGVEKGRIILFAMVFGVAILGGAISKLWDFSSITNWLNSLESIWFIIFPLVVFVSLGISYVVSKSIYLRKEF